MGRNLSLGGPEIQIIYNLKHPLLIHFLGYAISTPTYTLADVLLM